MSERAPMFFRKYELMSSRLLVCEISKLLVGDGRMLRVMMEKYRTGGEGGTV